MWLSSSMAVPGHKGRHIPVALMLILVLLALAGLAVPAVRYGPQLLARATGGTSSDVQGLPGAYTPGPTPPPQPGFKAFASPHSNYSIDVPQAWAASTQTSTVGGQPDYIDLFAPSTPGSMDSMLVELTEASDSLANADIVSGEVASAQQSGATFAPVVGSDVLVAVSGELWQRTDYLVTSNGATTYEAILAGHHEGHAYVIVLAGGADTFAADNASYFAPALASFRFNS
jgi:hypothetical protein